MHLSFMWQFYRHSWQLSAVWSWFLHHLNKDVPVRPGLFVECEACCTSSASSWPKWTHPIFHRPIVCLPLMSPVTRKFLSKKSVDSLGWGGLRLTVTETHVILKHRSSQKEDKHVCCRSPERVDQFNHQICNQCTRVDANRAPFGCEMMSCTSSGLFCMTSAASLKVTPSRLMLFREIRRPPADRGQSGILLASKKSR